MNFSLNKLKKYGFNIRTQTENDFYDICETEKIGVVEIVTPASFYFSVEGKKIIAIDKRKKGLPRLFQMFHELAHHFLHGGKTLTNAFFFGLLENKAETEADAVATIALIPRHRLANYDFLDEHPRSRFAKKLFKDRQRLEFLYGI